MNRLNKGQQIEMLQTNMVSRFRTLGNTYFHLTDDDLKKIGSDMNRYTTDVIYQAFYNWTEVTENKRANNLESFTVKEWSRKTPIPPVREKPIQLDIDYDQGLDLFSQMKKTLIQNEPTPLRGDLKPDKQEDIRE